jgi:CBS domain-containing protein
MRAKDIMTRQVVSVSPVTPVRQLARILTKNHISGVPVVDKRGKVVGIVSERDLIEGQGRQVKAIMNRNVIGVAEDTSVQEIASLMATRHQKTLPVLRGTQLAGIVSRADVVRAIAMGEQIGIRTPLYDL